MVVVEVEVELLVLVLVVVDVLLVVVDVLLVVVLVLLVVVLVLVVVVLVLVVVGVVVVVEVLPVDVDAAAVRGGSVTGEAELVWTLHPAATRTSVMTGSVTSVVRRSATSGRHATPAVCQRPSARGRSIACRAPG